MGLNRFQFTGNLTRDPELLNGGTSKAVVTLQLATNHVWYDDNREKQEKSNFFRIKDFGKSADNHAKYLRKGSHVYVEGRIENTEYEKNGETVYGFDFIADYVEYPSGRKD